MKVRILSTVTGGLFLILVTALTSTAFAEESCSAELSDATIHRLVRYVKHKYHMTDEPSVTLTRVVLVKPSCYYKLTFRSSGPSAIGDDLILYLSPDKRFLTSDLFDTAVDPDEEERRLNEAMLLGTAVGSAIPVLGPSYAPVSIVAFADFECLNCSQVINTLKQLVTTRSDVRVVFHHFPLSTHPWALIAAQGAACAQLQNSPAFWWIANQLLVHQDVLSKDTVTTRLLEYSQARPEINAKEFQTCINNQLSLGLIFSDMRLGKAYNVINVPTLLINGQHISNVTDITRLSELVESAKRNIH